MVDKEKILAGRKIIDAYRLAHSKLRHHVQGNRILPIDHSEIMGKMFSGLKALGFNSTEEFFAANEQLCYQEVERCYKADCYCDGCEGRERGCLTKCYAKREDLIDHQIAPSLQIAKDLYDWQHFPNYLPPGCSGHREKLAEPKFDIFWGMPTGITPEQHQKIKQKEQ